MSDRDPWEMDVCGLCGEVWENCTCDTLECPDCGSVTCYGALRAAGRRVSDPTMGDPQVWVEYWLGQMEDDGDWRDAAKVLRTEIERLRAELAYLRDHPGWVPPLPERREPK